VGPGGGQRCKRFLGGEKKRESPRIIADSRNSPANPWTRRRKVSPPRKKGKNITTVTKH